MLKNYIKIAWKVLLRRKFFTFISLFGISFTLMILMIVTSMLDQLFGAKAPESESQRMLHVFEISTVKEGGGRSQNALSYDFMKTYMKTLKLPEKVALYTNLNTVNAFSNQKKLVLDLKTTDEVFWEVTDFEFLEGRGFNRQDVERANMVTIINENTRKEYFGSVSALGLPISIDGKTYKVSGVVKNVPLTSLATFADVWTPYTTAPSKLKSFNGYHGQFNAILLAKSKKDLPAIKDEVQMVMEYLNNLPKAGNEHHYVFAETFAEQTSRHLLGDGTESKIELFSLLGILLMLLFMLLPTINLVNINISRIMERSSEIGVRRAFGATQNTLVGQFLVENIFLTLIGSLIGFVLSYLVLKLINNMQVVAYANFELNIQVFIYGLAMALIFGIISGVFPAYKMSRLQAVDALKGGTL
ncbi:MAG: ABC transporter permease [Bacteroidota bacterium]|nr:ABC transporter permease [Bacteroidota bacterium]